MQTFTKRVTHNYDDVYTDSTPDFALTRYLSAGRPTATRDSGLIFRNVFIPPLSQILSAKITFTSNANLSDTPCNTRLYIEDNVDPAQFTDLSNFNARTLAALYTNWDNMSAWVTDSTYDSPDLTQVVQQIIDRPDWEYNKSLGFFWKENGSTTPARRACYSYSDSSAKAPLLTVTYNPPPFIGMKISKPSVDVLTAENKDLIFSSDLACLKVAISGKYDFTLASGAYTTYTINHNLGAKPLLILVFIQTSSGVYKMSGASMPPNYWSDYLHISHEFTENDLYVNVSNNTGAQVSSHFYYFICYA